MLSEEPHLSDQQLLLSIDGELSARDADRVESHVAVCWQCRVRKQEIETAIGEFVRFQRENWTVSIPCPDGPRALLKARLAHEAEAGSASRWGNLAAWRLRWALPVAALALAIISSIMFHGYLDQHSRRSLSNSVPDPSLTPGAIVFLSQEQLCRETPANNKSVPAPLQRRVFAEYGIPSAEPRSYEVDYLITPALGGADDIRNLWPQPSSEIVWNAQVKDALESHLRSLVCAGDLDLATAQHEIATNWVEAYKRYFHTTQPVAGARD